MSAILKVWRVRFVDQEGANLYCLVLGESVYDVIRRICEHWSHEPGSGVKLDHKAIHLIELEEGIVV